MNKDFNEKLYDKRVRERLTKQGVLSEEDLAHYKKNLPNDEHNFDLSVLEDDDIGLGTSLSEEQIESLPPITEDSIDNFDFLEEKKTKG